MRIFWRLLKQDVIASAVGMLLQASCPSGYLKALKWSLEGDVVIRMLAIIG